MSRLTTRRFTVNWSHVLSSSHQKNRDMKALPAYKESTKGETLHTNRGSIWG